MTLHEIFQAKIDIKVRRATAAYFSTTAEINGRGIQFDAQLEDGSETETWDVNFSEVLVGDKKQTFLSTGSGGEFQVLSMVKDSMAMFIEQYQPGIITFTAFRSENSRASVYRRMLSRLLPSWKMEEKDAGGDIEFLLTRPSASN